MITSVDDLKDLIVNLLEDKKAEKITVIKPATNQLANYLILANGRSTKNVGAIADFISLELKYKTNFKINIEGLGNSDWVLIDIGDIIVHLFHPEAREYFKLEELWQNR